MIPSPHSLWRVVQTVPNANETRSDSFTYSISDGEFTATATVIVTVQAVNDAPVFPDGPVTRNVSFRAVAGAEVGAPVAATDVDGDPLTYTLSGGSGAFQIDESTGQITVTGNVTLDTASAYTVTVTTDDENGAWTTLM